MSWYNKQSNFFHIVQANVDYNISVEYSGAYDSVIIKIYDGTKTIYSEIIDNAKQAFERSHEIKEEIERYQNRFDDIYESNDSCTSVNDGGLDEMKSMRPSIERRLQGPREHDLFNKQQ